MCKAFISNKTTINIISIKFYIENTNERELYIKLSSSLAIHRTSKLITIWQSYSTS